VKNVITIARQRGSGGRAVGALIAERYGWSLISKESFTESVKAKGVDEVKIGRVFERRPSLQDRMTLQQLYSKYVDVITNVIKEFAEKGDVVILGRGANLILGGDPRVFSVLFVADLETRIERMAKECGLKGKKGLEEARKKVIDSDYARAAYNTYLYDAEWNDPLNYDMVLNTTGITVQQAAEAVMSLFDMLRR
jgi:cytidylate kinase